MLRSDYLPDMAQFNIGIQAQIDPNLMLTGNGKDLEEWHTKLNNQIEKTFKDPEKFKKMLANHLKELREEVTVMLQHPN